MSGLITVDEKVLAEIQEVSDELVAATTGVPSIIKSVKLQQGVNWLRKKLDGKLMDDIMAMQGTKLGFRTDKEYGRQQVREAVIEGLCRGAYWVGNEINIIGGNCYLTKEYFERKLSELDGLTDLRISEGVPQSMSDKGALVDMVATFCWQGQPDEIRCVKEGERDTRICVRVNSGMGADAILGKAHRKLYARIWNRCTKSKWAEAEVDEGMTVEGTVVHEALPEPEEAAQ